MSKRAVKKVRHYKPALTFKERVKLGMEMSQAKDKVMVNVEPGKTNEEKHVHEHSEHCNHG